MGGVLRYKWEEYRRLLLWVDRVFKLRVLKLNPPSPTPFLRHPDFVANQSALERGHIYRSRELGSYILTDAPKP